MGPKHKPYNAQALEVLFHRLKTMPKGGKKASMYRQMRKNLGTRGH